MNSPYGVLMRQWTVAIPSSAFASRDGTHVLSAFTFARGGDSISIGVDTTGPKLFDPTGSFDLYANAADSLDQVCVALRRELGGSHAPDADRAELVLPDGTVIDAPDIELFENDEGETRLGFCWRDVDVSGQLPVVGRANLVVNVFDLAGNMSTLTIEIRVHPWLTSVSPDVIDVSPGGTNTVTLRGVGLQAFLATDGDAVRVDDRDVAGGTVRAAHSLPGPAVTFVIDSVLPSTISPGALQVRIDGLESNRVRFDVCRAEPPKFVTERPFARVMADIVGPLEIHRAEFAMERGPIGEPVFAWTEKCSIRLSSPLSTGAFAEHGLSPYVPPEDTPLTECDDPDPLTLNVRRGDLVELLRRPDGMVLPIWVATGSGIRLETGDPSLAAVDLTGLGGEPRWLAVQNDPITGYPAALVLIDRRVQVGDVRTYDLALYILGPTATELFVHQDAFEGEGAYSAAMALGADGRGWILVSGDKTYLFRRTPQGTWDGSHPAIPGFVSDATVAEDGSYHVVTYGDSAEGLGEETVPANLRYYRAFPTASTLTLAWTRQIDAKPSAFRPPPADEAPDSPARMTAAAASIRVTPVGVPVIAYMDLDLKSVRLQRLPPIQDDIGLMPHADFDVDVATGHFIELALDGNGAALVAYADLSMAEAPPALPDPDDFVANEAVGRRLSASILLTDTRTNVIPRPGAHAGPSRCTGAYRSESMTSAQLAAASERQVNRFEFRFGDLVEAFCVGQQLSATSRKLCEMQGSAALASRLFENGTFTFRGHLESAGAGVNGTPNRQTQPDENSGLRVPVGYDAYVAAQLETGDAQLAEFHIANFQPRDRRQACDGKDEDPFGSEEQPSARVGAAMAWQPGTGIVLFGGESEGGLLLNDTWLLEEGKKCWRKLTGDEPSRQRGHAMATAPKGEGILLFGVNDAGEPATWLLDLKSGINGDWIELVTFGEPPNAFEGAMTYDTTSDRVWLLDGQNELWSFVSIPSGFGGALDYFWNSEGDGPDFIGSGVESRTGAGLAIGPKQVGGPLDQLYVFGGTETGNSLPRNDLFQRSLAGGPWLAISSGGVHDPNDLDFGPLARHGAAVTFSKNWSRLVAYGGATFTLGFRAFMVMGGNAMDAFEPSGPTQSSWEFIPQTALPVAREEQAWAVEQTSEGERLVLFGGRIGSTVLDDTVVFEFEPSSPPAGAWHSIQPSSSHRTEIAAFGNSGNDGDVQYGRADVGLLSSSPPATEILEGFTSGAFPPFGNSADAVIQLRFEEYQLGPGTFSQFMEPINGDPGEQGTFQNRFRFPFRAEGNILLPGDVQIGQIAIDSDLPVPLPPPLPSTELGCTLLLNGSLFPNEKPITIDAGIQLAVDDRAVTLHSDNTLEMFTGVLVREDIDVDIPLCLEVTVLTVQLGPTEFLSTVGLPRGIVEGVIEDMIALTVTRQLGIESVVGNDVELPKGVFGALGPLGAIRAIDAFTNETLADLRSDRILPARFFVFLDEPQWILLDDGLTISVRRVADLPGPITVNARNDPSP